MKVRYKYWTKARGIGGFRQKPEDFAVREILKPELLRKAAEGRYTLFLVKKRNMTTHQAVSRLRQLGWRDIGYAGLKDKFAVTQQYMSASAEEKPCGAEDLEAAPVGRSRQLLPGDLLGNAFVVTLHECRNVKQLPSIISEIASRGMPNYFGTQRFGKYGKNIEIGKQLMKKNLPRALELIKKAGNSRALRDVPKEQLRFFVNAYQSWIFNEALTEYISRHDRPYFGPVPIIGYRTIFGGSEMDRLVKGVCDKEGIAAADFRINELMMTCLGGSRPAFIRLADIDYAVTKDVKLTFVLPKGSYATVLLREICKTS